MPIPKKDFVLDQIRDDLKELYYVDDKGHAKFALSKPEEVETVLKYIHDIIKIPKRPAKITRILEKYHVTPDD